LVPEKVDWLFWNNKNLQFGNEKILLVEDEFSLRKLTYRLLVSLGYTVFTAGQSSEALEFINSFDDHIDLLITDVIMPVMNGKELAERVILLRPGIKTLYTSGYTENVISHQGVLKKGVIFIQRPFTKEELATKVREALESNQ
jgi:two-component system, cell cycle sensor histidine kinase and response regulator CckA